MSVHMCEHGQIYVLLCGWSCGCGGCGECMRRTSPIET